MRRLDREITDLQTIVGLVEECSTLRLAFNDRTAPYVVPVSFGYELQDGAFIFYVHGAKQGRRHELAAQSDRVCVELDVCRGFVTLKNGDQTADYRSFIGTGRISTLNGAEAVHGLELLCRHCGFDAMHCTQAVVDATCVEKIVVDAFTAKQSFETL